LGVFSKESQIYWGYFPGAGAIYAVLLLPGENTHASAWRYLSIGVFLILILAWSANVLADGEKSELLKGAVAFGILIVFGWLFYLYSGAEWDRLQRSFFDWNRMAGNWGVLFEGLLVTLEIAFLSAIFSVVVGLTVAILRHLETPHSISFSSLTLTSSVLFQWLSSWWYCFLHCLM
jgi:ABC-type phosphate/phosphonate transport system permease subunit